MSYLNELRRLNPQIADYTDEQIVSALPKLAPDRFGGKSAEEIYTDIGEKPPSEGGFFKDLAISWGIGSNQLLKGAGDIYGAVTGDYDNWASQQGQSGISYFADQKSDELIEQERARSQAVNESDGELAKMGTAIWETIKNPRLLLNSVVETAPNLVGSGAIGLGAKGGVAALGAGAKAASSVGIGANLGTQAALQGASVAEESYRKIMDLPDSIWDLNPEYNALTMEFGSEEAKKQIALSHARNAGSVSAALSVASQRLPGGATVERAINGNPVSGGLIGRALKGAFGEGAQEMIEEGGGKVLSNNAVANVDAEQSLTEDLGETAGIAAITGAGFGGPIGALSSAPVEQNIPEINQTLVPRPVRDLELQTSIDLARSRREQVEAQARQAREQAAQAGGDALDQVLAETQVKSANINVTLEAQAEEAKAKAALSETNKPAVQRNVQRNEDIRADLDRLINIADSSPDGLEDAARLRKAKELYQKADDARQSGSIKMADLYIRQANRLYESATQVSAGVDSLNTDAGMPAPYSFEGSVEGTQPVPAGRRRPEGQTYDGTPDARLTDQQIKGNLPPGTGQINMGRDSTDGQLNIPPEDTSIGRNVVEREASAQPKQLPAPRTISSDDYRRVQALRREAIRTKVRQRTPEHLEALAITNAVQSGEMVVSDERETPAVQRIEGERIDDEWVRFTPESGTLNIPRSEMPQVSADNRGALVNYLNARGIEHEKTEADPGSLKPTQAEFSLEKVNKAREFKGGDRSILVSSDGHVVDGHHQWMAKRDQGESIKVIRLDAPIADLVPLIKEFPSSDVDAGSSVSTTNANERQTLNDPELSELNRQADITQARSERAKQRHYAPINEERDDLLAMIAKSGGISREEASAQGIDDRSLNIRSGIRPVFTKNGKSFDEMAEHLSQYGIVVDSAADRFNDLYDKLFRAVDGGEVVRTDAGNALYQEELAQTEAERYEAMAEDYAPISTEFDYENDELTIDDWIDLLVSAKLAEIEAPYTQEDIQRAISNETESFYAEQDRASYEDYRVSKRESSPEGSDAGRNSTQRPESDAGSQEEDLLTSYTEQDVADREQAAANARSRQEAQERAAEQKRQADAEAGDFLLTGSDTPSDQAAARGQNDLFSGNPSNESTTESDTITQDKLNAALSEGRAPEHAREARGVSPEEFEQIKDELNDLWVFEEGDAPTNVFINKDKPVRLNDKVKKYVAGKGWMTPSEADAVVGAWRAHADKQGNSPGTASANANRVVLSLFDLTGKWAEPWARAGYDVYTFDIQDSVEVGDVNNFSVEFFNDYFGAFEGRDVHAIIAACPCTDFASSGARHFAAKDNDGRTIQSIQLVQQTMRTIEYFKPAIWAIENPVGRIGNLNGLPPWHLSFDPFHFGEDYTKKTLLWGRFNADLPIAPTEPTEGSKMHKKYGGKSVATKNARSATPEGFAYAFFMANNATDHPAMALHHQFDRLPMDLFERAFEAGLTEAQIREVIEDPYWSDMDDEAAIQAVNDLISEKATDKVGTNEAADPLEDFGEKLGGARKDELRTIRERLDNLDDEAIASSTVGKLWPKGEIDKIESTTEAAIYHALRSEIPNKPRVAYKVRRWVEDIKAVRNVLRILGDMGTEKAMETLRSIPSNTTSQFADKVELLESLPRSEWGRIDTVRIENGEYKQDDEWVRGSWARVKIDGRTHTVYGIKSITDAIPKVKELIESNGPQDSRVAFEIRSYRGGVSAGKYFIMKTGDKEHRAIKLFDTLEDARKFKRENYDEVLAGWEEIKERDNVRKADIRSADNRDRAGQDYRKGKDVTPDQFSETFGFRGVEFGNWVKQGTKGDGRQNLLNQTYDSLMDLANILGIPPKAISLEGQLGLGLGSRGKGWASAHFEPDTLVINLTKTRGAGSLAHEWFHALDNYFSRKRGTYQYTGDDKAYRENSFVTYKPEPMYVLKDRPSTKMTLAQLERAREMNPDAGYFKAERWQLDPKHPDGVRPVVEKSFSDLVNALDQSPMKDRASKIDKGKTDGYWSQIIERAARSFESYIIAKMNKEGYNNDFLANVVNEDDFKRDPERYPYIKRDEMAPIEAAFDNLFGTIEHKETDDGNVALFSRGRDGSGITAEELDAVVDRVGSGFKNTLRIEAVSTFSELPSAIKDYADKQGSDGSDIQGVFHKGTIYLVAENVKDARSAEEVIFHEATHAGFRKLLAGRDINVTLNNLWAALGGSKGFEKTAKDLGIYDRLKPYIEGMKNGSLTKEQRNMVLIDEMIAFQGQNVRPSVKKYIQELIGKIRAWFRDHGFAELAKLKASDIAYMAKTAREFADANTGSDGNPVFMVAQRGTPSSMDKAGTNDDAGSIQEVNDQPAFSRAIMEEDEGSPEQTIRSKIGDRLDSWRFQMQDKLIDLKRKQEEVGAELEDEANPYQKAAIWEGKAGEELNDFDESKIQPLLEKVADTNLDWDEIGNWLVARHAEEANAYLAEINPDKPDSERYRLSGMSNEEAQSILDQNADNAALQDVGSMIDEINRDRVSLLVDRGLMDQEMADAWQGRYQHYVPLKREEVSGSDLLPSRGQGFSVKGKESKMRTGSAYYKPGKIIANVLAQYEASVVRAHKNEVANALLNFVEQNPDENFWYTEEKQTQKVVRNGKVVESGRAFDAPNELKVKRDGKEITIVFNPENKRAVRLVTGLKNLQAAEMGSVMRGMAKVTRFLSSVNTSWNPEFVISNFARDIQTAGYNLSGTEIEDASRRVLKSVPKAMAGIKRALINKDASGEWAELWEDFRKHGGKTGWIDIHNDMLKREHDLKGAVDRLSKGKPSKGAVTRFFNAVDNYNAVVENGVRLSAYKAALDAGMSKDKAAALAKDLTVNFNRKGNMGPQINALYMFYNASVQGSVRLLQAMATSKKGRRLAAATIGFAFVLDMVNRSMAGDDDDGENLYDQLPDYVKNHNIIIMGEKEPLVKIPAPWGYNVLHTIGQVMGEAATSERFDALDSASRVGTSIIEAFNPVGSATFLQTVAPTVLDPFVQIGENKSFMGTPLKPEHTFDARTPKPEYQMHWASAREASKDVAKWLNDATGGNAVRPGFVNVSPEWIDLIWDTAAGGAGRTAGNTVDTIQRMVEGKEFETQNTPFIRKVTGFDAKNGVKMRYYDWSKTVSYADAERRKLSGPERSEALKRPEQKLIPLYKSTEKVLRTLRKQRRAAEAAGDLDRVDRIDARIREKMARFNERYAEVMLD